MIEPVYYHGYKVFKDGRIKTKKDRILKGHIDKYGYLNYCIKVNGKTKNIRAHRIIAECYLGKSDLVVNLRDENKLNNNINNLEYLTREENTRYSLNKKNKCKRSYLR